jgi:hypothetical protein
MLFFAGLPSAIKMTMGVLNWLGKTLAIAEEFVVVVAVGPGALKVIETDA